MEQPYVFYSNPSYEYSRVQKYSLLFLGLSAFATVTFLVKAFRLDKLVINPILNRYGAGLSLVNCSLPAMFGICSPAASEQQRLDCQTRFLEIYEQGTNKLTRGEPFPGPLTKYDVSRGKQNRRDTVTCSLSIPFSLSTGAPKRKRMRSTNWVPRVWLRSILTLPVSFSLFLPWCTSGE